MSIAEKLAQKELGDLQKELRELKKEKDFWKAAFHENPPLAGNLFWDGATYGYACGVAGNSDYHIAERLPNFARDISILLDIRRQAHDDVGLIVLGNDPMEAYLLPLTFFLVRYNTGDEIVFQYVAGKTRVVSIKTHDGLIVKG
jgi:hypothetical protein